MRGCVGVRQAARVLGVQRGTVSNKIMRLSRQVMAMHAGILEELQLKEDLTADGLASYWVSQYMPNNFNVLLGAESRFLFDWDAVTMRRSGGMTEGQKQRREELEKQYKADPKGVQDSFGRLIDTAVDLIGRSEQSRIVWTTDEHHAYTRAFGEHAGWKALVEAERVSNRRVSSRRARTEKNPLSPVNIFDRQVRNDMAEHVRETIRFARNCCHSRERFVVNMFGYNYVKPLRVNQPAGDRRTHAEAAGVRPELVRQRVRRMFTQRAFLTRTALHPPMKELWLRAKRTPLKEGPEYLPAYLEA